MRYLVTAQIRAGRQAALSRAIEDGTLGAGSIAGCDCDCTARLEQHLAVCGQPFLEILTQLVDDEDVCEKLVT